MTVVRALWLRWNRTTTNGFVFRADGASRQTVAVVHGPRFERLLQATSPQSLSPKDNSLPKFPSCLLLRTPLFDGVVGASPDRTSQILMDLSALPEKRLRGK